ncbi:MAG: 3-oxoacid CoA-transferase subunit B [Bradyrhizobiaceae bacterium]|nr:MAG: 3-oxoacid CoA-transferase subunit B [Bradyrhizobiaceae bacterium]
MTPLSREQLAEKVAAWLPPGSVINLGIGIPGLINKYVRPEQEIILQSENGIIHFEGLQAGQKEDTDSVDASKRPVSILPGGAYIDAGLSFALMRGGHIDVTVLGAFEVSEKGDIANWWTGEEDDVPGVGGAMDLASGAKSIWVVMEHMTRGGQSKIVRQCSYPLTAPRVVSRIFTDLAVLDVEPQGLVVVDMIDGLTRSELQKRTAAPLIFMDASAAATGHRVSPVGAA